MSHGSFGCPLVCLEAVWVCVSVCHSGLGMYPNVPCSCLVRIQMCLSSILVRAPVCLTAVWGMFPRMSHSCFCPSVSHSDFDSCLNVSHSKRCVSMSHTAAVVCVPMSFDDRGRDLCASIYDSQRFWYVFQHLPFSCFVCLALTTCQRSGPDGLGICLQKRRRR